MGNKRLWLLMAAVLAGSVTVGLAEEEQERVSVGITADLLSKYVWRGQNVVDDWVLQPTVSAAYKHFTASVWGNMDLAGDVVDGGEFNEIDYALDYSNMLPDSDVLGYSVGVIYYDFPNTAFEGTTEVYGGLTADVLLSPTIRAYQDVDEIDGTYVQFSLGHTIEKIAQWRDDGYCDLQAGASLGYGSSGYNDGYFGVDDAALNDLTVSVGLPICVGNWTIKPIAACSTMIDDDIRAATAESDNFWGGVSAAYQF